MNTRQLFINCFRLLVLILVLLPVQSTQATISSEISQLEPYLVKDIFPGEQGSEPQNLTKVNSILFFTVDPGDGTGHELWKSDGTTQGTMLVKDINPSSSSDPQNLVNVNETLFFSADPGDGTGRELWKSDGTTAGTIMVKDLNVSGSSDPQYLIDYDGWLAFTADSQSYIGGAFISYGRELWLSDGSMDGTFLLKDIYPGARSSNPKELTNVNGFLYFSAVQDEGNGDSDYGRELWATVGHSSTVRMVKDIDPGPRSSNPYNLTKVGDTLFFGADTYYGVELWKSKQASSYTTDLVKDIPDPNSYPNNLTDPSYLTDVNGTLFFIADSNPRGDLSVERELWASDGTAKGTYMVKNICCPFPSGDPYADSNPYNLTNVNGTLFFVVESAPTGHYDRELWKSDGTTDGTTYVVDIAQGSQTSNPDHLTDVGGTLFFVAENYPDSHGRELWKSDGTPKGTAIVYDIYPGFGSSSPENLTNVNGTLFFTTIDPTHGRELWAIHLSTDLALQQSTQSNQVLVGKPLTLTIEAQNKGGYVATNVVVTNTLPTNVQLNTISSSQGSCEGTTNIACHLGTLTISSTATISIVVVPTSPGILTNTSVIAGILPDPDLTNNTSTLTTTVLAKPIADLGITLNGSAPIVQVGSNMAYQIEVVNNGPFAATNVVVNGPLPAGANFISANASQGSCAESNRIVTCNFGTLEIGKRATANLTVNQTTAGNAINTMTVSTDVDDPTNGNNTATANTEVTTSPVANLGITVADSADPVYINPSVGSAEYSYEINAFNDGPSAATSATVRAELPAEVVFLSATADRGNCAESNRVVTCNIGTLAAQERVKVSVRVRSTTAANVSCKISIVGQEIDPLSNNNNALEETSIRLPEADLEIVQSDSQDPLEFGQGDLIYKLEISHGKNSANDATGVILIDQFPVETNFVSASPSQGTCALDFIFVRCNLGTIVRGSKAIVNVTVRPNIAGRIRNRGEISMNEHDPLGSNYSVEETEVLPAVDLTINNIELTQAIQNAANEIPLVAYRSAFARLYIGVNVQGSSQPIPKVMALVHAERKDGVDLPYPPIRFWIPIGDGFHAPISPRRDQLFDTLNEVIPSTWLTPGELTIAAEVNPEHTIKETNYNNNFKSFTFQVVDVPKLKIVLIPIAYQRNGTGPTYHPSMDQTNNFGLGTLQQLYPISQIDYTLHSEYLYKGDLQTKSGWDQLLAELVKLRQKELPFNPVGLATAMPKYYGVLPHEGVSVYGGLAYVNSTVGMGLVNRKDAAAHEIGHNFGFGHANCDLPSSDTPDSNFPANGRISELGYNLFTKEFFPTSTPDYMSYCRPAFWTSIYGYRHIMNMLRGTVAIQAQISSNTNQDALLISGWIAPNDESGSLDNALPISTTNVLTSSPSGTYGVELIDTRGTIVSTYQFDVMPVDNHSGTPPTKYFSFFVPRISDLDNLRLLKGSAVLATLQVTAKPVLQTVQLIPSNDPANLIISWQGKISSSGAVDIHYSRDNGQTWQVLAQHLKETQLVLDKTMLAGSPNGLLKIVAIDGADSDTKQLSIGEVANKKPLVSITNNGNTSVLPNQQLTLSGSAIDFEDGTLTDSSLTWTSNQGEVLALGSTLVLTQGLTAGTHIINLTATDSQGLSATTSVEIFAGIRNVFLPVVSNSGSNGNTTITGLTTTNTGPTKQGQAVRFTANVATGSNIEYVWDFDDGDLAKGQSVTHIYKRPDTYNARVFAINSEMRVEAPTTVIVQTEDVKSGKYRIYLPMVDR